MGLFRKKKKPVGRIVNEQGRGGTFTYYQNREDSGRSIRGAPKAQTLRKPKRRFGLHHLPTYLAVAVIAVSFLYMLTLNTTPKIVVVNEQDETVQSFLRPREVYQDTAQSVLRGSIFNKTKITINTDSVAEKLQESFPEATDIAVTLPLVGRRPVVYMRVAAPVLELSGTSGSFVVDEKGRAVVSTADAPNADKLSLLKVEDKSGLDIQVGQQALPKEHVEFMKEVQNQLKASGLNVSGMTLPPLANELYVSVDGLPYYVKFNFLNDAKEQSGTFLAVKQKLDQEGTTPAEYIDVRVAERAYYK